jgi:hypothetical protein
MTTKWGLPAILKHLEAFLLDNIELKSQDFLSFP